ncbi:hypothetical protein EYD10_12877 [Varanus komodoensis]|nr:hypothetical protein EYD10_12877 [Varanus komodoensis]
MQRVPDDTYLEQQNISSLLPSQYTVDSVTQKALTQSAMDLTATHVYPESLSSPVTNPSEMTSLDQEGSSRVSIGQNIPTLVISVISNEAVLSDDRFMSSFPNAQQTPSLKSFTEDYHLGSFPVKPTKETLQTVSLAPSLPALSSPLEMLQTTLQRAVSVPLPYLKPFDVIGVTLTPSRDLLMPLTYLTSVVSEVVDATAGKGRENSPFHALFSTSVLFDTTVEESPVFTKQLNEDMQIMTDILTNTDTYTEPHYSINSSIAGTLSLESFSVLSIFEEIPVLLTNTGTAVFSTHLPFVVPSTPSATFMTASGSLFNEELFTHEFSHKFSRSTGSILHESSKIPTQVEFFRDSMSPVPFTRPYASCSYCDFSSASSEPVFSLQPSENEVGSGDYIDTLSFVATEVKGVSPLTSVVNELYDMQESPPEVFDTTFPSRLVVSFSSRFTEDSKSNAVEISLKNTIFTPVFSSYEQSSEVIPLEHSYLYSVTEMAASMSSIMEEPQSDVATASSEFVFVGNVSTPYMTIRNSGLLETPEYISSESTYILGKTLEGFPTQEYAVTRSDIPSSLSLTPFPSEPNVLSHLSSDKTTSFLILPSDLSTFLPHVSPTFLLPSVLFDNSSTWGSAERPDVDITSIEASQLSSWQTSFFNLNSSSFPVAHSSTTVPSSNFYMNSSVYLEPTSILTMTSEFYFTSAFTEATSQFESSSLGIGASIPTQVLPTSVLETVFTSNSLGDETHVTSWFSSLQRTPNLPSSTLFSTTTVEETVATAKHSLVSSYEAAPSTFFLTATSSMPPLATELSSIKVSHTELVDTLSSYVPTIKPSSVNTSNVSGIPTRANITEFTSMTISTTTTSSNKIGLSTTTSSTPSSSASTVTSVSVTTPQVTMATVPTTTTRQPYVCDITVPDKYLVTAGKTFFLFILMLVYSGTKGKC